MSGLSLAKKINIFVIGVAVCMSGFYAITSASVLGRDNNHGYFTNIKDVKGDRVFPNQIPRSINNANDFMFFIQTSVYQNGTAREKVGAAFVVNTFLGRGWSADRVAPSESISSDMWTEFFNLLKYYDSAKLINWHYWTSIGSFGGVNSYYQGSGEGSNPNDDAYYIDERAGMLIETIYITNTDGSFAYAIKYECGNPVGIPKIQDWNIVPTAYTAKDSVKPGDSIDWNHRVTVQGNTIDKDVEWGYYHYVNNVKVSQGVLGTLMNGSAAGSSMANSSQYVTSIADSGKTICRSTYAIHHSKSDDAVIESEKECVAVGGGLAVGVCRPMIVNVPAHTSPNSPGSGGGSSPVRVSLTLINQTTNEPISFGSYYESTNVNVTPKCTTGDKWTVHIDIAGHTESWRSYACGCCGRYCRSCETCYESIPATEASLHKDIGTVGPCFDYLLKPSITPLSRYQVEVDSALTVNPLIGTDSWTKNNLTLFWNNYHTQTKSKISQWQISKITVRPDVSIPVHPINSSNSDPCTYYKSKGFDKCLSLSSGSDTVFNNNGIMSGSNALTPVNNVITDEPAGSKICYAFSVLAGNSENSNDSITPSNTWVHSATASNYCVIIVKKPKVQVLGGDLSVGKNSSSNGNIATTTSIKSFTNNYIFGSWAEYGVFAKGSINGLASASALNGGMLGDSLSSNCQFSKLSFNNICNGTSSTSTVGNYNFGNQTIPDISSSFPFDNQTSILPSSVDMGYFNSSSKNVFTTSGDITITGGILNKGKWAVINSPNATVTISGDIQYTSESLRGINDIPQLVIIAKNINILNSASQVDAWLVARNGYVNTCSDVGPTDKLTAGVCQIPLTINGPVVAKSLYLRRTAGSDPGIIMSAVPAEKLNLRADAYLWSYARSTGTGKVWTVYNTNVPPRL